jgi:Asp/Glu/hydantoin racemase
MSRSPKLALIHTSEALIPVFGKLCEELLPQIETTHISDSQLIKETIANAGLVPSVYASLHHHVEEAIAQGADVVMVTCSSMGMAVEASHARSPVPVLRVDLAMADRAISLASRIGVLATLATTLRPTVDLIERRAVQVQKQITVSARLCDGAFAAWQQGDGDLHDRLVLDQLRDLIPNVDVVVLAQASMARVLPRLTDRETAIPILTSPRLAMESLVDRFNRPNVQNGE